MVIIGVLLLTPYGAAARFYLELLLFIPHIKLGCPSLIAIVYAAALVASLFIPWRFGVNGWTWKEWVMALMYTAFSFETFLSLVLGSKNINK